jgi:mono/diheme cytochrome c family protein
MSNETIFFIFGIALAVSAVGISFIGLKVDGFPGKAMPIVVLWFVVLAGGATTFAVLHAKDEDKEKAAEYGKANEEFEKETSSGPYEEAEEKAAEEGKEGEAEEAGGEAAEPEAGGEGAIGDAEAGAQVFASAGCSSCHTLAAAGATGSVGPNLDEVLKPGTSKEFIEESIVDPEAEVAEGFPAGVMPPNFGALLSEEELADVVEFIYVSTPAGEGG